MPAANQKSEIVVRVLALLASLSGLVVAVAGFGLVLATVLLTLGTLLAGWIPFSRIQATQPLPTSADDPYLTSNPMNDPLARYEAELSTLYTLHAKGIITSYEFIERVEKLDDPKSPALKLVNHVNGQGRTLGYGYTESIPTEHVYGNQSNPSDPLACLQPQRVKELTAYYKGAARAATPAILGGRAVMQVSPGQQAVDIANYLAEAGRLDEAQTIAHRHGLEEVHDYGGGSRFIEGF